MIHKMYEQFCKKCNRDTVHDHGDCLYCAIGENVKKRKKTEEQLDRLIELVESAENTKNTK